MALRGHASIQGSTDIPTLFNLLSGYLPMPMAGLHDTFADYLAAVGWKTQKGYWANADTYMVSMLKAWWGDAARADNDWAYDYLPRLTGAHGTYQTVTAMLADEVEGYFLLGQNPAVGSANGRQQRLGMSHLKWLVVRDLNLIESATWWKDGPEIVSGELRTEDIATEVFFLPAASHVEKAGSFTQTQRLLQWRHKAIDPPGDCQSELDFFYKLGQRIREKLADSTDERDRPLLDLTWDYPTDDRGDPDPEAVLAEINGYRRSGLDAREPLSSYTELRADGSTTAGCWIYTGVYAGGVNQAANRVPHGGPGPSQSEWGWAWPANRRILYNRASADPDGKPWSERKKWVWWDDERRRWVGDDVPDFVLDRAPGSRPDPDLGGPDALAGDDPFIMQCDGKGWLFASAGMVDGPLPTHYEPQESPVANALYPQQQNPARVTFPRTDNLSAPSAGAPGSDVYPYVFTTYRVTEHHTAGGMSRWLPYLSELQPEMFCEVSPELAAERGLEPYGWATIVSPRAAIEARVLVTDRMTPLVIAGHTVHQIGLPYHWGVGQDAIVSGDGANDLLGVTLDPNVQIQESKAGSCDIRAGRRPQGEDLLGLVAEYQARSGATIATDNARITDPVREIVDPPPGQDNTGRTTGAAGERRASAREPRAEEVELCPSSPDRPTPRPTRGGRMPSRAKASSRIPRSASAARPARWPARSGTTTRATATWNCSARPTTTPARLAPAPGGTSPSSNRDANASKRHWRPAAPWSISACPAWAPRRLQTPRRPRRRPRTRLNSAGLCRPTCASTARTPDAWTCALPARCSVPNSAPS